MPNLTGILETVLYVDNLERSLRFYRDLFNFTVVATNERLVALIPGDHDILLLFSRDQCGTDLPTPGGVIPRHRAKGDQHLAFSIPKSAVDEWKDRLSAKDITIESEVD